MCAVLVSHVWLFETLWTVAHQAPLSMGFSRQEYRSGLPFFSPGDLPDPGIESASPVSPALQSDSLCTEPYLSIWLHWVLFASCRIFFVCVVCRLSSCGTWVSCPVACGILVFCPGIESMSPVLEGRFSGPPEKSLRTTALEWLRHWSVVLKSLHWNLRNTNRWASARVGMCLLKVLMLKPNPLGIGRWGIWEAIRSWEQSCHVWHSCFRKRPQWTPLVLPPCEDAMKCVWPSLDHDGIQISDLQPPELRNQSLFFISHPGCGILL